MFGFVKLLLLVAISLCQVKYALSQRQWVPPTTTAAEMRNPYTWYWPYAIAASEAYRDYFINAQQITNQLYQQAYATNAFWWTGGGGQGTQRGQRRQRRPGQLRRQIEQEDQLQLEDVEFNNPPVSNTA